MPRTPPARSPADRSGGGHAPTRRGPSRAALLVATLLLTSLSGIATGQDTSAPSLVFGPDDPDFNNLPAWIASPGVAPCRLDIPPGEDHGAYYALEGRAVQNGISARYVAAVEGLPEGDPEAADPEPLVVNLVLVRLEGLTAGRTYTIEEPFGVITSLAATASRMTVEVTGDDPQLGPITDLSLREGTFRVLDGATVLVDMAVAGACVPYEGDPSNAPPVPLFTTMCSDATCTFDAADSTDSDGEIVGYSWDFGDGTPFGSGVVASHTYTRGGTFTVRLTVLDDGGTSRSTTQTVTLNHPPLALFAQVCTRRACTFDATASSDSDGTVVAHAWQFGDGANATGAQTTHTYAANGIYVVNLTVTDDRGATNMTSRTLNLSAPTLSATFHPHNGNDWWVQTRVVGSEPITAVCASVSGGPCQPLTLREWGSWAASFFVPAGSLVQFTASAGEGNTNTSGFYRWPSGAPVDGGDGQQPPPPGDFAARFLPHNTNEWWVQARVTANEPVRAVCASVDGGACRALTLREWGSWAASFFVPHGATVVFRATSMDGDVVTSGGYRWPSATPVDGSGATFAASFEPHDGNQWWVQTRVTANQPVASVCASVEGRACQPLTHREWGSWAASFFVQDGATVTFRATSTTGATATSPAFTWPVR